MENPDLEPYRAFAEAGPFAVAEEARRRGVSPVKILYVLHEVCGLSIGMGKEVLFRVDPEAHSFHTKLLADLDAAQAEMDRENDPG